MDKLFIRSLKRLRQADRARSAVIAVSSYEIAPELLAGFAQVLEMRFADTAQERSPQAFQPCHAAQIREFFDALPDSLDALYVCCDAGESRSAAMAAAILRYRKGNEWAIWDNARYHPNPLVYRRLCEAFGCAVSPDALRQRVKRSENALANAIRKAR